MLASPDQDLGEFRLKSNGELPKSKVKSQCKNLEPKLKYMQAFYRYMKDFKCVKEINFWYVDSELGEEFHSRNITDLKDWLENGK